MRLPSDYIVFDLETTGLSPAYSEIIEIGAVKIIDGKIEDIFQTYVKNTSPIPEKITALTGITENDTKNAPKINVALKKFSEFVSDFPLIAHNARFDCSFIGAASFLCQINFENPVIDSLEVSRKCLKNLKSHKLEVLKNYLGIELPSHNAVDDCKVTYRVIEHCRQLIKSVRQEVIIMSKAKWIWYFGEYEIFHSLQLHSRRTEFGADYPTPWYLPNVFPIIDFTKNIEITEDTEFSVHLNGIGYVLVDSVRHPSGKVIKCVPGKHLITVKVMNYRGLPAAFVKGDIIYSDESWTASVAPGTEKNACCTPAYFSENDNVEIFPFSYEKLYPVSVSKTGKGYLYDFGRETFGFLNISDAVAEDVVYYGESKEEAMATDSSDFRENALVFRSIGSSGNVRLAQTAFRFVHVVTKRSVPYDISSDFEFLPLKDRADFSCEKDIICDVFKLSAYTFRLNSREFYLDGIKRDRWVWSGDAYQSFMINRYLHADNEIVKRTILALLGKPPYFQHINTITDYSFFLIISVYDYWIYSGDLEFVKNIFDRLSALYSFCLERTDENGFIIAKNGDWIFIDWADLDKEGPICAEQILFWKASKCMEIFSEKLGLPLEKRVDTDELKNKINRFYYNEEKGGYIDGFVSGKNKISRHQNIFALMYGFADCEKRRSIIEKVILSTDVPEITTPYFQFYQLIVMCENGLVKQACDLLESYWGGMLKLGATSVWEQFDENDVGTDNYKMYGHAFGKSLCHAWGSGPILILGKYVAGVRYDGNASGTFTVKPELGIYETFNATVPLPSGNVTIIKDKNKVTVITDVSGGTLIVNDKKITVIPGKENTVELN